MDKWLVEMNSQFERKIWYEFQQFWRTLIKKLMDIYGSNLNKKMRILDGINLKFKSGEIEVREF